MISIKKEIAQQIHKSVDFLTVEEIEAMIEIPQESSMGDYAFPCFKLAKQLHKAPPMIAADLASSLKAEMFDILGQQTNISRTIDAFTRNDSRTNAIYQYALISAIFRFSVFGGKNVMGTDKERS